MHVLKRYGRWTCLKFLCVFLRFRGFLLFGFVLSSSAMNFNHKGWVRFWDLIQRFACHKWLLTWRILLTYLLCFFSEKMFTLIWKTANIPIMSVPKYTHEPSVITFSLRNWDVMSGGVWSKPITDDWRVHRYQI